MQKKSKLILILIIFLAVFLRFFALGANPPALYWDEASLGYNAYSILKSGRDEHNEKMPLNRFIAFGDYKPPGYIYTAVPAIAAFGLNEFSVRLPSAISSVLSVYLVYLLTASIFKKKKIALSAAFLLSVSPWSLQLSRAAFEANLAAFFNLAAIYFFLMRRKKAVYFIISVIFFMLAFYTFNANRIISPLMLLTLIFSSDGKTIQKSIKEALLALVLMFLLIVPSLTFLISRESKLRLQEVSIFNNLQPVELANQRIAMDGDNSLAKLIHNRRFLYLSDYLKHYFDNFSGRFLFTHGDVNPRLAVQGMGQLYFLELIPLVAGILGLILIRHKSLRILLPWVLIVPLPSALAKETPHALRIISLLPVLLIFTARGIDQITVFIRKNLSKFWLLISLAIFVSLYIFNILYYLHLYYLHFPNKWSGEWQYGYKEMVEYVLNHENSYDRIFVTEKLGRPYIYFAFYRPSDPLIFRRERVASRDWFGFWRVESLGKIAFSTNGATNASGKILLVDEGENLSPEFTLLKKISDLSGKTVFTIGEK